MIQNIIGYIRKPNVYIQTHNYPDPDAIASAFGLQYILKHKGIDSIICYSGEIDRFNIRRMIKYLNISMIPASQLKQLSEEDEVILVDSQKGNNNIINLTENDVICIDHHPIFGDASYVYSDIRPGVGACSSIITEYFVKNELEIPKDVATALLYGIKVDTANLSRGVSEMDLDMHYHLFDKADLDVVRKLEHSTLQIKDLNAYANAIHSIKVRDNISFANTGVDCPEALIATISDFMMSIADVHISVVYSIRENGIKLSVRSEYHTFDVGLICNQVLKGIGSGGGHEFMAGGFVPLGKENRSQDELIALIEQRFISAFGEIDKRIKD